jgi:hypothetical protein
MFFRSLSLCFAFLFLCSILPRFLSLVFLPGTWWGQKDNIKTTTQNSYPAWDLNSRLQEPVDWTEVIHTNNNRSSISENFDNRMILQHGTVLLKICVRFRTGPENRISFPKFSAPAEPNMLNLRRITHQSYIISLHRITGVLDFFHYPVFLRVETRRFGNWICFRPQVRVGEETYSVGPLRKS